ncbi:hypothetical protein FOA52_000883 [Chlamydomonas sp. UWO 241]|nr:hypothetical protein FOA52_000883 [Chlamydomonas sp. UWO 241]
MNEMLNVGRGLAQAGVMTALQHEDRINQLERHNAELTAALRSATIGGTYHYASPDAVLSELERCNMPATGTSAGHCLRLMCKLALRPSPPRAMGTRSKTLKDLNNLNLMALGAGMAAIAADAAAAAGGAGAGEESMEGVMVVAGTRSPRACLLTPGRGTRGATNAEVPSSAMSSPVRAPADHDEMHMGIPPPDPSAAMHRGMRELLREEFAEERVLIREEFSRGMAALAARVTETEARGAGVIAAVATLDARITSKFAQADVAFGPLLRLVPELSVAKDGVADLDARMGRMEKHEVLALAQFLVDQGKSREMAAKVAALTEQVQALEAAARGGEAAGRQVPMAARAPVTVAQPVPAAQQQLPGPPQPPGPPPLPAAVGGGGLTFAVVVRERVSDARHALARGTERALTTLLGPHHVTVVQARVMFANDHKSKVVFTVANEGHAAFIRARMLLPRCTANMRRPGCAIFPHLLYAEHQSQRRMAMRGVNVKKSEGVVFNDQFCPVGAAGGRVKDRQVLDSRAALNTSSYVNVFFEPEEMLVAEMGMRINLADQTVYPESFKVHNITLNMVARLWNCPYPADFNETGVFSGAGTVGSTEACLLAGLCLKFRWREWYARRHPEVTNILAVRPNLVISTCFQAAWEKLFRYMDIEPKFVVPSVEGFTINAEDVKGQTLDSIAAELSTAASDAAGLTLDSISAEVSSAAAEPHGSLMSRTLSRVVTLKRPKQGHTGTVC